MGELAAMRWKTPTRREVENVVFENGIPVGSMVCALKSIRRGAG
jgi:hypothetical protein